MAMTKRIWSISAAAVELGRDRRTVAAALSETAADGKTETGHKGWFLETIIAALSGRGEDDGLDYAAEKARLTREQADAQEMKNAMLRRDLIAVADVSAYLGAALARVRARMLALPAKAAPLCHAAVSVVGCEAVIRDAVMEALLELSQTSVEELCGASGDDLADPETAAEAHGEPMGGPREAAKP